MVEDDQQALHKYMVFDTYITPCLITLVIYKQINMMLCS